MAFSSLRRRLLGAATAASMLLSGCAASHLDPFPVSNAAMMHRAALEIGFDGEIGAWLSRLKDKKVVLVNLENEDYVDDELADYMIHDAFYTRFLRSNNRIQLLERDADLLNLLRMELEGIELESTGKGGNTTGVTEEERLARLSNFIEMMANKLSENEAAVFSPQENREHRPRTNILENIVSNEVGDNKLELLRLLIDEYKAIWATETEATGDSYILDIEDSDYLLGYRVYEYGVYWGAKKGSFYPRTTYLKVHVRAIEVESGKIVVSDFMEHRIDDEVHKDDRSLLRNVPMKQSDFNRPQHRKEAPSLGLPGRKR